MADYQRVALFEGARGDNWYDPDTIVKLASRLKWNSYNDRWSSLAPSESSLVAIFFLAGLGNILIWLDYGCG